MHLTESETRFQLKRLLQSLSRQTRRDLTGAADVQERGMVTGVEEMMRALGSLKLDREDVGDRFNFGAMKNRS